MRWILLFLLPLLHCDEGQDKLNFMLSQSSSSSDKVIDSLTKSQFSKHIANGPRPYGVLLFLTVLGSESSCKICGQVHDSSAELAQSLEAVRKPDGKQAFVVEIDYSSSGSIISELGLDRVPQVLFIPPTKSNRPVALSDLIDSVGKTNQYALMTGYETSNFLDFINKVGKLDIDLTKPVGKMEVVLFIAALVILTAAIIASWSFIDKVRQRMVLYMIAGVACYCFCVGGGMYSIIRNTPWHGGSKSNPEYINRSGRNQFTVEGYLMGICNFIGGLGAFLYVMINRYSTNTDETKDSRLKYYAYIPSVVAVALLGFGWYCILYVYNLKSPHYRFGFVGMTG